MKLALIDLEATCDYPNNPNLMEIVEIGIVAIDISDPRNPLRLGTFNSRVKPRVNPILTEFCKTILRLEQSDIDSSAGIDEVMGKGLTFLEDYEVSHLCSWGQWDANQLRKELAHNSNLLSRLNTLEHYNLKKRFAKQRKCKQVGLVKAAQILGLKTSEHRHHEALSDALLLSHIVETDPGILNPEIMTPKFFITQKAFNDMTLEERSKARYVIEKNIPLHIPTAHPTSYQ